MVIDFYKNLISNKIVGGRVLKNFGSNPNLSNDTIP
jgi:hypothetical protein